MLRIIASNFLKIRNGCSVVDKYAATVVYVGAHLFPQFLEKSRSSSNSCNTLISSKKHYLFNEGEIDNCTKNLFGITDANQNYEECKCEV